jgi:hypothetical protein
MILDLYLLAAHQFMLHILSGLSKAFQWPSILVHSLNRLCFLLNPTYFINIVVGLKHINFHDLQAWCPSPNSRTLAHLRRGKLGCLCWQLLGSLQFWCLPAMTVAKPSWNMATAARMFSNYHFCAYGSHHTLNWTELHDFWKKVIEHKMCFNFLYTLCLKHISF